MTFCWFEIIVIFLISTAILALIYVWIVQVAWNNGIIDVQHLQKVAHAICSVDFFIEGVNSSLVSHHPATTKNEILGHSCWFFDDAKKLDYQEKDTANHIKMHVHHLWQCQSTPWNCVHQIATKQKGTPSCMFLGHWLAVFDPMSLMLPLLLLLLLASQQGNYSI